MPNIEHPKARLDCQHSCQSSLAFGGVQESMQILLEISFIFHIQLILSIFVSQPYLLTVFAPHCVLPQIFHEVIPVMQNHSSPNLVVNRARY
jgi:hypothetical protein